MSALQQLIVFFVIPFLFLWVGYQLLIWYGDLPKKPQSVKDTENLEAQGYGVEHKRHPKFESPLIILYHPGRDEQLLSLTYIVDSQNSVRTIYTPVYPPDAKPSDPAASKALFEQRLPWLAAWDVNRIGDFLWPLAEWK